jgi:hypothetical protein
MLPPQNTKPVLYVAQGNLRGSVMVVGFAAAAEHSPHDLIVQEQAA